MGIGGLDNEFNAIFRRAFASRVFPPEIVEQLGMLIRYSFNLNFKLSWVLNLTIYISRPNLI